MADKSKLPPAPLTNEGGVIKNKDGVVVSDNPIAPDVRGSEIPAILMHSSNVNRDKRLKELAKRNKDVAWLLAERGDKSVRISHSTHSDKPDKHEKTVLEKAATKPYPKRK